MKTIDYKTVIQDLVDYCRELLHEFVPVEEEDIQAPAITGIWIAAGNSYPNRWIFKTEGIVEKYYNNELYKIYYWDIRPPSDPSESNLRELILANVNNPGTEIGFQISVLTGEQLVLQYSTGIDESERVFDRY
ncbi:hypothetical protein [Rhodohalobacter sp. 8-1]|uniref:hypothetical protein n=1 Tax=Rhodohalobacter sp. 8-1 TaxID=3131972 RepID=UPI0030EEA543